MQGHPLLTRHSCHQRRCSRISFCVSAGKSGPGSGMGLRSERPTLAQFVDTTGVGKLPGSSPAVARIIDPLRPEALRTAFEHRNAIFEIRRMPRRDAALSGADMHPVQRPPLEVRIPDRMLSNEPCGLRTVVTGNIFRGPTQLVNEFAQTAGILDVNGLHARNVAAP